MLISDRVSVIQQLQDACRSDEGLLMLINLDSFELFNDVYGHDMGDVMLEKCIEIINDCCEDSDIKGSLGGDEFVVFCRGLLDKGAFARLAAEINKRISASAKELIGTDMKILLGASIGGVFIPEHGRIYEELFHKADLALEYIKQTGNHGCAYYNKSDVEGEQIDGLETISKSMDEGNHYKGALWLDYDYFSIVYKYVRRYIQTYKGVASKLLITIEPTQDISMEDFTEIAKAFGKVVNHTLRKSDIMMQSRTNQYFILLPEMTARYIEKVRERIMYQWEDTDYFDVTDIIFEAGTIVAQDDD